MAAGIFISGFIRSSVAKKNNIKARIFEGLNGWGYDILVDDSLFIHQESVPVKTGSKGFSQKEQAEQTAQIIINKMKRGEHPTVTTFEIEQIVGRNSPNYDKGSSK
jgi:hypothetical protein